MPDNPLTVQVSWTVDGQPRTRTKEITRTQLAALLRRLDLMSERPGLTWDPATLHWVLAVDGKEVARTPGFPVGRPSVSRQEAEGWAARFVADRHDGEHWDYLRGATA